jgi:tRNA(Ile)-lysidine synthase TilS/MesJ
MEPIPTTILDAVNQTISKYKLFPEKEVVVAFSGGKDSLFLCLVLRELGYTVKPVTFDVGYNIDWKVAKSIAARLHFHLQIFDLGFVEKNFQNTLSVIENNYKVIQEISRGKHLGVTICTPCYNSKMILLREWCKMNNGTLQIAFGHHGTDMVTSFLKSYFMYIDRWEYQHIRYNDSNFENLIKTMKPVFCGNKDNLLQSKEWASVIELMKKKLIGTDEPIRKNIADTDYAVIRPMSSVLEVDIKQYYNRTDLEFQESECSIRRLKDFSKFTPREMVHHILLDDVPRENMELLLSTLLESLDILGYDPTSVRNNRNAILGTEYKSGDSNSTKL